MGTEVGGVLNDSHYFLYSLNMQHRSTDKGLPWLFRKPYFEICIQQSAHLKNLVIQQQCKL